LLKINIKGQNRRIRLYKWRICSIPSRE